MKFRQLPISLIAALPALGFAAPANATPPDRFAFSESASDPHFLQCDGFEIGLSTTASFSGTVFFDASGEVFKFIGRTQATDILTNSVTGKTVVNRGEFQEIFTRIDGTDEFSHALVGFRFMGTSPGEGLVLQDVGRIVYSPDEEEVLFLAGQHKVPDAGFEVVFCAAVA